MPKETRIEVHLKAKSIRRCQNPVFKGRLSGWSLSLIDFNFKFNDDQPASDVIVGTYDLSQMPASGKYYVEIIVLLCEGYGQGSRAINLKSVCLEDVEDSNNRVTAGNGAASIDIFVDAEFSLSKQRRNNALHWRGQWVHKNLTKGDNFGYPNDTFPLQALSTRYQPEACNGIMYPEYEGKDICEPFMSRKRFEAYTFHWNNGADTVLNEPGLGLLLSSDGGNTDAIGSPPPSKSQNTHVCFMGVSHSRVLQEQCEKLLNETRKEAGLPEGTPLGLQCSWTILPYPKNLALGFNTSVLDEQGCTHVVVGLFQWYFSFKQAMSSEVPAVTFSEWESQMITGIRKLEKVTKNSNSPLRKVVLRSAHPNGLKFQNNQCPPQDVRSPVNAAGATAILREIVDGFTSAVSMVDTSFIIDPVWDAAEDFSHYTHEEGEMEAKFLLTEILRKNV